MNGITVRAFGKVNLSLNIVGRRGKLHALDSIITSVDLCDDVTVHRKDGALRVVFAPCGDGVTADECASIPPENSVTRAIRALQSVYPALGVAVEVKKRLPFAGGMGGSSADAAGVLFALDLLYPGAFSPRDILRAAECAGSDVPAMFAGGFLRLTGTGGEVARFSAPPVHLCIVKPEGGVESREAYRVFDALYEDGRFCPADNDRLTEALRKGDFDGVARSLGNALSKPAVSLCPAATEALSAITAVGGVPFVTGSGSCCCGLFTSREMAEKAAGALRGRFTAFAASSVPRGAEKI